MLLLRLDFFDQFVEQIDHALFDHLHLFARPAKIETATHVVHPAGNVIERFAV